MSTIVGYACVSTREQDPAAQAAELRAVGAVRVFTDHGESSRTVDRPGWQACLDCLRADGQPLESITATLRVGRSSVARALARAEEDAD